MSNLRIALGSEWSGWLWFLLVPLIAIALILFFRVGAKQRKTRYRIISLVLHISVAVLGVALLTGLTYAYDIPYDNNELIILVDVSGSVNLELNRDGMNDSQFLNSEQFIQSAQGRKNAFIRQIISANSDGNFRVGIVLFARNQFLAAPLTSNSELAFNQYIDAILHPPQHLDTRATNIAAALSFARDQFENPLAARKVVLLTDGLETDGTAGVALTTLLAEHIVVDVVHFEGDYIGDEVQINGIRMPGTAVMVGETVSIDVTLQSSFQGNVNLTIFNNNIAGDTVVVSLPGGIYTTSIDHTFTTPGAQQLLFRIESGADRLSQNNQFYHYFFIDVYDTILIIDQNGEGENLQHLLNRNEDSFSVPVERMDINNENLPRDIRALSRFDQVILVNIANRDMPDGFDELLHEYVYIRGGGLLVIGGNIPNTEDPNAFCPEDLNPHGVPSLLQEMLPVQAEEYWPPLSLMIVLDVSGSMNHVDNPQANPLSRIAIARLATIAAMRALSHRDYVGIITFSNAPNLIAPLTPIPQTGPIEDRVRAITAAGGTNYAPALRMANQHIMADRNVQNRHIMFITDGEPTDDGGLPVSFPYLDAIRNNEVTFSVVSIMGAADGPAINTVTYMVRRANNPNVDYNDFLFINRDIGRLTDYIRASLEIPAIRDVVFETFHPSVNSATVETAGLDHNITGAPHSLIPPLHGFVGTRAKTATNENALVMPLSGPFGIPIYTRWRFGQGRVGAFTSDLSGLAGSFSDEFMDHNHVTYGEVGPILIERIVRGLLPSHDIQVTDLSPQFTPQNFNVHAAINTVTPNIQIESIEITVTDVTLTDGTMIDGLLVLDRERAQPFTINVSIPAVGLITANFEFPDTGIFQIRTVQTNIDGTVFDNVQYKIFSYSSEFNAFDSPERGVTLLEALASQAHRGGGRMVSSGAHRVYDDNGNYSYVPGAEYVLRDIEWVASVVFDPRTVFLIIIISFFLIDIAVRKFKFKWPWEIVRDRRIKKQLDGQRTAE